MKAAQPMAAVTGLFGYIGYYIDTIMIKLIYYSNGQHYSAQYIAPGPWSGLAQAKIVTFISALM